MNFSINFPLELLRNLIPQLPFPFILFRSDINIALPYSCPLLVFRGEVIPRLLAFHRASSISIQLFLNQLPLNRLTRLPWVSFFAITPVTLEKIWFSSPWLKLDKRIVPPLFKLVVLFYRELYRNLFYIISYSINVIKIG